MTKAELGTKRICPNCGTKYYDLNRDPIVCPRCGTYFEAIDDDDAGAARGGGRRRRGGHRARGRCQPEFVPLEEADEEEADTGAVEVEGDDEEVEADDERRHLPRAGRGRGRRRRHHDHRRRRRGGTLIRPPRASAPQSAADAFTPGGNWNCEVLSDRRGSARPVAGSGPRRSRRGHSSVGRALEWHSRGRRFDSAWLHQPLLQKPRVLGDNRREAG